MISEGGRRFSILVLLTIVVDPGNDMASMGNID